MTDAESAVLAAAKKWLAAKEAVLRADEAHRDPMETERLFDQAEYELTTAIYRLLGRDPHISGRG